MTTKQRFDAAVNVIRNLPKNGAYQPSHSLMLAFYSYFKQATEGSQRGSRPAFWDVVGRAKWDAWNKLGNMPREEAMQKYIDELNKIVETMSLTDSVADFLQSMESYPGNPEDIELSIGPLLERVRSQPSTPLDSQETTPSHKAESHSSTPSNVSDIEEEDDDDEDDEFVDTLPEGDLSTRHPMREDHVVVRRKDTPMVMPKMSNQHSVPPKKPIDSKLPNGYANQKAPSSKGQDAVSEALQKAVESLRRDLTLANEKVKALEERQNKVSKSNHCMFSGRMSPRTVAFVVLWPIFVHYVLTWISRRKRH